MGLSSTICFHLAKRRVLGRQAGSAGENPATFDHGPYQAWRKSELETQFRRHFDARELQGKDVLDFGCGEGDLSLLSAREGANSVIGIDLDRSRIESAIQRRAAQQDLPVQPEFVLARDPRTIDLPDAGVDVILCFDVLEHIMAYRDIIPEWMRVLRPGGVVLIWWVPWYHPYGHHIESLVPIPWAHVVFSDRTLIETCRRIYDLPSFKPRLWDLDENGNKKPNKWGKLERLPDVNRLKISTFEGICRDLGFRIEKRDPRGFGSSDLARLTSGFVHVPVLREFFTSSVAYKLRKP